jgi:diguanylate cyclase (GGDEF)-like protein
MGVIRAMNLPPTAVFIIIVVIAVANILILLAVAARSRADRVRQFAQADGILSSSYRADRLDEDTRDASEGWLAAKEEWPTSRQRWPDGGDDWPAPGWAPPAGDAVSAPDVEPVDPPVEPFVFPPPSPLEQRSWIRDDAVEASDPEGEGEDDGEDEDEDETMAEADVDEAGLADDSPDDDAPEDELQDSEAVSAIAATGSIAGRRGRDPLTGMLDPLAFEEVVSNEEAREARYGRPATVIVFELDGLARLVDRLGPEPGDRIETALGDTIRRLARRADHVARLERGRYAVLLPETDEIAAINYVERIRRACDLWLESGAIAMRLAIGWASTAGDSGLSGAIRVATERMRVERRRIARQLGDTTPDLDAVDGNQPPEAVAS